MTTIDPLITADHADALRTAGKVKGLLCLVIVLALLTQVVAFFVARYGNVLPVANGSNPTATLLLNYLLVLTSFAAILAGLVLPAVLMLLAILMLVGRSGGVAKTVSAFGWSLVLLVLLFPWQSVFLNPAVQSAAPPEAARFVIPGVLYSWGELAHDSMGARFPGEMNTTAVLRWARYVAFPLAAMVIAILVHVRSGRGARQAVSELVPMDSDLRPAI